MIERELVSVKHPVVERGTRRFMGIISLADLLKARSRHLEEKRRREQIFRWRDLKACLELRKGPLPESTPNSPRTLEKDMIAALRSAGRERQRHQTHET